MLQFSRILLLLMFVVFSNCAIDRQKRGIHLPLVYPQNSTVLHFIGGFGVPVEELYFESVTTGIVFKAEYKLPSNLVTKSVIDINGRATKFEFYKIIEKFIVKYNHLNGKACVLRSICELAAIPFQKIGLISEIMHILLTPTVTLKDEKSYRENEYYFAEHLGRSQYFNALPCANIFKECPISIIDQFTTIFE